MANKAEIPDEFLTQLVEWQSEGLSLRAIATKLVEAGGPAVDPKTIAARLKKPVQSLEHITESIRHLAVPLDSLKLDPRNARRHPDGNLAAIKGSLKEFGQMKPIVANKQTNGRPVVIAGNGTIEAAKALGWTHIAAIIVNISETTAQAFALADNRTSELAEWDNQTLAAILMELENDEVDVAALGFDDEFVKGVLEAANQQEGDDEDDSGDDDAPIDKAAELQKKWSTERGQIWEIPSKTVPGKCHRVMCGDSLDPATIEAVLDGQVPDGVWSDAPYGMAFDPTKPRGNHGKNSNGLAKSIPRPPVIGDETTETAEAAFVSLYKCYPNALHLWWGANHYSTCLPASSCWIVWDKENGDNDFADVELAWCSDKGAARMFRHMWNGMIKDSERGEQRLHATQKPIALFEWCSKKYLPDPGKVWLDPFAGSGISILGAERCSQIACAIELSESYVAVILERATNAGLEPRLANAPTI